MQRLTSASEFESSFEAVHEPGYVPDLPTAYGAEDDYMEYILYTCEMDSLRLFKRY